MSGLQTKLGRMALVAAVMGTTIISSGCSSKSKAAAAQTPPPPSLSTPVRPETTPTPAQSSPQVVPADEYAFMKNQQGPSSQPLPSVSAPQSVPVAPPPPPQSYASSQPVSSAPVSSVNSNGGKSYTMQKGDTLYGVARKFNVPPKNLIAANSFKDPNQVAVGTKVMIP